MTSLVGYDTNFYSIADIHQDLNLPYDNDSQELEFLSGSNGDQMFTWKQWMDYFLFNKKPERVADQVKSVIKGVDDQLKTEKLNNIDRAAPFTVYDVLGVYPQLSKFKEFCDYIGYGKLKDMEFKVTLFAPINDKYDEYMWYLYNVAWTKSTAIDALRYHILPYLLLPWQLKDRKLRLRTDLERRQIDTDWTKGKQQLLNPLSYSQTPMDWFPKMNWEINIIGTVHCDNGIVYIIDRPIVMDGFYGSTGGN